MNKSECDSETGLCEVGSPGEKQSGSVVSGSEVELIYVGDPMCSWCWGIAPALRQLQPYCAQRQWPFRVVVGGLRAGGGDRWNAQFKQFLAHHWREIGKRTGQPFSYEILARDAFDYDTEPACRSVVAARMLLDGSGLGFFAAVQRKFYVDNEDPKQVEFYRSICADSGLDFDEFSRLFQSDEVKATTRGDFQKSRDWGVTGFPTVLLRAQRRITPIATGFSTFEIMRQRLEGLVPGPV